MAIAKIRELGGYFNSFLTYVPADFGMSRYGDILFYELDINVPMRRVSE